MPGPHNTSRAQQIRIILRHHNDPEGKFTPKELVCQDYEDGKGKLQKGCGASVWRYKTFPNQKSMRFDGPPIVVPDTTVQMGDGSVVAKVETTNVHYGTCAARRQDPPVKDFRTAAAGGIS